MDKQVLLTTIDVISTADEYSFNEFMMEENFNKLTTSTIISGTHAIGGCKWLQEDGFYVSQ